MKRYIHIAIIGAVVIGAVLLMLTYGNGNNPNGNADNGGGRQVTLMLDWTPNVNHVGIFVADAEGFFARHGLSVDIVQPGEVYPAAAVLSGKVEFGIDYQEYLTLLSEQQQGLLSVAAILQSNTSGFATRTENGIESVAEFSDLTYGTFGAPFEEPTLRALLACEGASSDGIAYVPIGTDPLAMLSQRRADVVWIFYGTQGFQAETLGVDIDYFPMQEYTDCIPDYYTPILIASEEYVRAEPRVVRQFLAALDEAYEFIVRDPQRAADILATAIPELNRGELHRSVSWLTQYMHNAAGQWGGQELRVWQDYANWMYAEGLLTERPTAARMARLFTNEYLPQ